MKKTVIGNSTHYSHQESLIQFLEHRGNTVTPGPKIGMDAIHQLFEREEYEKVLPSIWAEKTIANRIKLLEKPAAQFHIPAMLELGTALVRKKQRVEGSAWLGMAIFCVLSDKKCYNDSSISQGNAAMRIAMVYQRPSIHGFKAWQKKKLATLVLEKTVGYLKLNEEGKLPSPKWLEAHGLSSMFGLKLSGKPPLKAKDEWAMCRAADMTKSQKKLEEK